MLIEWRDLTWGRRGPSDMWEACHDVPGLHIFFADKPNLWSEVHVGKKPCWAFFAGAVTGLSEPNFVTSEVLEAMCWLHEWQQKNNPER